MATTNFSVFNKTPHAKLISKLKHSDRFFYCDPETTLKSMFSCLFRIWVFFNREEFPVALLRGFLRIDFCLLKFRWHEVPENWPNAPQLAAGIVNFQEFLYL